MAKGSTTKILNTAACQPTVGAKPGVGVDGAPLASLLGWVFSWKHRRKAFAPNDEGHVCMRPGIGLDCSERSAVHGFTFCRLES